MRDNKRIESRLVGHQHQVRILIILSASVLLLMSWFGAAGAQSPVDDQLTRAMSAMVSAFTECNSTKFLECVAVEKNGLRVTGFLARTINGGDERTDIDVTGNATAADALRSFKVSADSYRNPPANNVPPVQFWATDSFAAGPGQEAVMQVWFAPNPDSPQGNGLGILVCGNLNAGFKMFLTAPPGTSNPDGKALVDTTHIQLKELMQKLMQAFQGAGACSAEQNPPGSQYPGPYPTLATISGIDNIRVSVYPKGFSSDQQRSGSTGMELHWGDKFCFRGKGTLTLTWFDGSAVSFNDPTVGSERGRYTECIEITLKRPSDIPAPGALPRAGQFILEYLSNLPGFVRMVVNAAKPPPDDNPEGRFQASTHSAVLAIKGTTFVLGEDQTGTSIICTEEGVVTVTPRNSSLAPFDLRAGNQVQVTANAVGAIAPGCTLPSVTSISQPNTSVTRMTLQAARRYVVAGDTVLIPFWLVHAQNLANLNFEIGYDPNMFQPAGDPAKGNLLDNALFTANPKQSGQVLVGLAQTSPLQGTGTVVNIPFRAIGKPGDVSPLLLSVTTINDPNGGALPIDRVPGELVIVNDDGTLPPDDGGVGGAGGPNAPGGIQSGDCDGSGTVNELDALCALEMSTGVRTPQLFVDADNSGDVSSRDAVIILQRAVGQ